MAEFRVKMMRGGELTWSGHVHRAGECLVELVHHDGAWPSLESYQEMIAHVFYPPYMPQVLGDGMPISKEAAASIRELKAARAAK